MTTKPKTRMPIVQAIARHKAAQAALDAVPGPEDYPEHLCNEEDDALDELAFTPCASDAEFLEKLRYLYTLSKRKYGTCRTMATITVVSPSPPQSLLSGERMTIRLRYRTLKLSALCWVLRRLRAGQRRPEG
jgi:hypothetical protein